MLTRCVAFVEDQITGFQLIQRAGIEYQAQAFGSMGNAICQLDYEPQNVPSSCFGSGAYWQYFHRTSSGWAQSSTGASSMVLHDGDMDGWRYGAGSGQAPANLTFSSVCAPTTPPAASATTLPTRTPAAVRLASAPPSRAVSVAPVAPPTPTATPSLVAMAPTVSPSPKVALAATGPARPPPSTPIGTWLLLGGGASLLVGLAGINLRRRP